MGDTFARLAGRLQDAAPTLVGRNGRSEIVEIFAESSFRERLTLSDATRTSAKESYAREDLNGTGVRIIADGAARFACTDSLEPADVEAALVRIDAPLAGQASVPSYRGSAELPTDSPDAVSVEEKRYLLERAADAALALEPALTSLELSFQGRTRRAGVWASDIQPALSAVSSVGIRIRAATGRASAHAIGGGTGGLGRFFDVTPEEVARECIDRLHALERATPDGNLSGEMPVLLEAGWGGVWLHETVGHLLEADTQGPFGPEMIGLEIGSAAVTIEDDGTMDGGRGSSRFDDEGAPAGRTLLVESGRLAGLLSDRNAAHRIGIRRTPNGRRQDFRYEPMPRMTNLLMRNGSTAPRDLRADVRRGLYVRMIGRGEVRPAEDTFSFDVLEGYVIERGRLAAPVTGLRISGRPSEVLHRVVGVGNDFRADPARGVCRKRGQTVPVSVGMPSLLIDRMSVSQVRAPGRNREASAA